MAETVYFNDGSMDAILGDKGDFLERLLREKLGDDVARCFTEYVSELQEEAKCAKESIEEQERIADGYHQLCNKHWMLSAVYLSYLKAPGFLAAH